MPSFNFRTLLDNKAFGLGYFETTVAIDEKNEVTIYQNDLTHFTYSDPEIGSFNIGNLHGFRFSMSALPFSNGFNLIMAKPDGSNAIVSGIAHPDSLGEIAGTRIKLEWPTSYQATTTQDTIPAHTDQESAVKTDNSNVEIPSLIVSNFGYDDSAGGWRVEKNPRAIANLTNNGRGDIVGFGGGGVWASFNKGDGTFSEPKLVLDKFGFIANDVEWRVEKHPRLFADLTGNGCADIVGFGEAGVWVALNNGDASFREPQLVRAGYGSSNNAGGWRVERHPRFVTDLTGNGRADIIGFGNEAVWVMLNNGDGTFGPSQNALTSFGYNASAGNWRVEKHPRLLADLTGNKCADIVGFYDDGIWVAFNNGDGTFRAAQKVVANFGYNAGGWRVESHPRFLTDLTGNGCADIVGFGAAGVWVSFNNGDGTFREPKQVLKHFGSSSNAGNWRVAKHPRFLADLTGNGCADIVGFYEDGVWVALNKGDGSFAAPQQVIAKFGYSADAGDWRVEQHPRVLADLMGTKRADIIGFGPTGTWCLWNQFILK